MTQWLVTQRCWYTLLHNNKVGTLNTNFPTKKLGRTELITTSNPVVVGLLKDYAWTLLMFLHCYLQSWINFESFVDPVFRNTIDSVHALHCYNGFSVNHIVVTSAQAYQAQCR